MNPSYLHTPRHGQEHVQLFIPTAPLQVESTYYFPGSAQPNKSVQQDSLGDF